MSNGSMGEVSVIEFRSAIQELLHSRIQEAITITLEEELAEALGCGPYERNGSRRGYRHGGRIGGRSRWRRGRRIWRYHGDGCCERTAAPGSSAARSCRGINGAPRKSTRRF